MVSRRFTRGPALLNSEPLQEFANLLDGFADMAFIRRLVLSSRSLLPSTRHNGMPTGFFVGTVQSNDCHDLSIIGTRIPPQESWFESIESVEVETPCSRCG